MKFNLGLVGKSVFALSLVLLAYAIYQGWLVPAYNNKTVTVDLLSTISLILFILGFWLIVKNRMPERS
jgi:hypothetical protein